MSLNRLNELVTRAAKAVYDNEKFPVGVLAVQVSKAAQAHPTDQTLINMAGFLTKRAAASNKLFITRAELKDVYNRLYTPNNKFAGYFAEELGITEAPKPKTMVRDPNEGKNLVEHAYENLADPILSNALASAWDKSAPLKMYSKVAAVSAQKSCAHELNRQGLPPKKIDVVAGQEDILICKATYDTPKGESHVLIPVEVKEHRALLPTMFLSRAGFVDLEPGFVKDHLVSTAGKSYKVDVQKLLEVVATAKNGAPETLSDVERIVMKQSAAKETPITHTANGILYQQVDQPIPDVQEPQFEQPEEVKAFAQSLTSSAGIAEFTFGKTAVDNGRQLIRHALSSFGYPNAQVAVADCDKSTIFYAVAVDNGAGFKVPVKVDSKKRIQEPSLVIAAGTVAEFSKSGISGLLAQGASDNQAATVASPLYGLKPSEVMSQLKQALATSNYLKAEDALNVLKASGDDKAFSVGFELYKDALKNDGGLKKEASTETCCSMQYKVAHSKYMICGHTNLPIHKVYQDKNGDCHPMYRKGMSETAEGGSFLHSKIYMG
ncbi:MAG TPA: hypothetical protein VM577_06160 [Anaerovoracaceae bacterium]|nr:hypothetical protein [Anaerovoracaceae bacterium]